MTDIIHRVKPFTLPVLRMIGTYAILHTLKKDIDSYKSMTKDEAFIASQDLYKRYRCSGGIENQGITMKV